MITFITQKKYLILALIEDLTFIFFLFLVLASSMEIILPGILSNKLPLALIFTVFALLLFVSLSNARKERVAVNTSSLPLIISLFIFGGFLLTGIFMTRAFGVWGAGFQTVLLLFTLSYWLLRKEK